MKHSGTVHPVVCIVHPVVCTVHPVVCIVHHVVCTVHPVLCTVQCYAVFFFFKCEQEKRPEGPVDHRYSV